MRSTDVEPLAVLFEETQAHYKVPCPPRATILRDLGALPPGVDILVAEADAAGLVGYACVATIYPGPLLTTGLFEKELYITTRRRSQGAGKELMRACATLALDRGYQRIDFTANRENGPLIRFYTTLGAELKSERAFYRFDPAALRALAQDSKF